MGSAAVMGDSSRRKHAGAIGMSLLIATRAKVARHERPRIVEYWDLGGTRTFTAVNVNYWSF